MIGLWIFVEVLLGISLAYIVGRASTAVGAVLTLTGITPIAFLTIYTHVYPPTRDMSAEGMLVTLIFVLVTPVGVATLVTGLIRRA